MDDLQEFGLLLPAMASGRFSLSVLVKDSASCVVGQGRTDTTLTGSATVRLNLPLKRLAQSCSPH